MVDFGDPVKDVITELSHEASQLEEIVRQQPRLSEDFRSQILTALGAVRHANESIRREHGATISSWPYDA